MADYAIGDVQGCYDPLMRLLERLSFDESNDRLWFVGDLVNRGPHSLLVLRWLRTLKNPPQIVLGNHDLYLLACLFTHQEHLKIDPSLVQVIEAHDGEALGHWLRQQALFIYDDTLKVAMVHAGLAPMWSLSDAQGFASEIEAALKGPDFRDYLVHMWGDLPAMWSSRLRGHERLRVLTNYFTRMRVVDEKGALNLKFKGTKKTIPKGYIPWYQHPHRQSMHVDIVFGHWAALNGQSDTPHAYAIDTGCVWNGTLTAIRLQDKKRFSTSVEMSD